MADQERERLPQAEWQGLRNRVLTRDDYECVNCGATGRLEVHHVVPVEVGGENRLTNLCTLCIECHNAAHGNRASSDLGTEHSSPRWVPSIGEMRTVLDEARHPLDVAVLTLLAKTGIGKGELCNLTLSDLALLDDELANAYEIDTNPPWGPTAHPSIRIRIPDARTEFAGRRERVGETLVPLDFEALRILKRWLAVRPDTPHHEKLFTSTSEWGRPMTRGMVSKRIDNASDGVDLADELTAFTFRTFFERQYPPDNQVREYILGYLDEPPMDFGRVASHYAENVFVLHPR